MQLPPGIRIQPDSLAARIAAWKMGSDSVAMVWRKTILLWGVDEATFLQNERWVRHELQHVEQYRRLGWLRFVALYLWYSLLFGYQQNPLEIEAREAEEAIEA